MTEKEIFGRETEEKQEIVKIKKNPKLPPPMFLNHFPEMGYAILRSSNW